MDYQIKTIDINAKEWLDKATGNSYFAGKIILNYGLENASYFIMDFQYGYGEAYLYEALKLLKEVEMIQSDNTAQLREEGIVLRYNIEKNCKKADLKNI